MSKNQENIQEYFNANKLVDKVFTTSDGFIFLQHQLATIHSNTLSNKKVETFNRAGKVENIVVVDAEEITAGKTDVKLVKEQNTAPVNPAITESDQQTKK
ncbi:hypothetical protein PG913_08285 [Tenacibaculum pacificus]|uniref:hypothetical protein n=1 Tax=Tenacibaculum pacificus TaxID=3018314 RepID=UPI0022F394D2|nr:hypothetical protein [Tenacibaculum pacificus]WBX72900.1 hypothetical protein PG913_08285 [Tenacibaculum pacificus]